MLMSLLTSIADKSREIPIGEASLYAFLGFLVVFLGIAFLIFVVWLIGKIISNLNGGQPAKTVALTKKPQSVPQAVPQTETIKAEEEISEEIIAVIMAAIAAHYETNHPKCEFTVKRIKKFKEKYYA